MTREQALAVAKINASLHSKAMIAHMFNNGRNFDEWIEFGYRHGWYMVGEFSFNGEDITGIPYDPDQGGWAYL